MYAHLVPLLLHVCPRYKQHVSEPVVDQEKKCPGQAKQKEVWENKIGLSQDPRRQLLQSFPTAKPFLHALER